MPGTYVMGSHIYASALGKVEATEAGNASSGGLPVLSVVNTTKTAAAGGGQDVVLEVGHVVLARVLRITSKQAHVEVVGVGTVTLRQASAGIIKKEDVRQHEVDRVEIHKCFRPGDIVRARVVSLGDSRQYYLSTAESELGVLYAKSQVSADGSAGGGAVMVPISWETMRDPVSGLEEPRKVAKPSESEGNGAAAAAVEGT